MPSLHKPLEITAKDSERPIRCLYILAGDHDEGHTGTRVSEVVAHPIHRVYRMTFNSCI